MIGSEYDQCVLAHTAPLKHIKQIANLVIDIGDIGKICLPSGSYLLASNIIVFGLTGAQQTLAMWVDFAFRQRPNFRIKLWNICIKIVETLAGDIGVMRMCEAHGQTPGAFIMTTRKIVELGFCLIGDFIVILELIGDFCRSSTGDRAKIMIPPVNTFARLAIIRCPAKIGRINVCRQALFKAVQLIRADKMHFA